MCLTDILRNSLFVEGFLRLKLKKERVADRNCVLVNEEFLCISSPLREFVRGNNYTLENLDVRAEQVQGSKRLSKGIEYGFHRPTNFYELYPPTPPTPPPLASSSLTCGISKYFYPL